MSCYSPDGSSLEVFEGFSNESKNEHHICVVGLLVGLIVLTYLRCVSRPCTASGDLVVVGV
jgi:hypothetical protein